MELTQENIDALSVNEVSIMKKTAEKLHIRVNQVSAVVGLVSREFGKISLLLKEIFY